VAVAQHVSFFPSPPPHVERRSFVGVIERYGIGTSRGELVVARHGARHVFAVAHPYRIDGREISCHRAPTNAREPRFFCDDWPANVVLGRTVVDVSYWPLARRDGSNASDSLRTLPRSIVR